MNKKVYWIIGVIIVFAGSILGAVKYQQHQAKERERISWLAPHYNDSKDYILLSTDVDKLNDKQEKKFYGIARGVIESENPDISFTNLDDYSLFVKKAVGKHNYYIKYVCENPTTKLRFETTAKVTLKKESLKGTNKFDYWDYESDLDDY